MITETFDPDTIYCVVKARMDLGESPHDIFNELKVCKVIDISALQVVMSNLYPNNFPKRRTAWQPIATIHQLFRRDGTDGR